MSRTGPFPPSDAAVVDRPLVGEEIRLVHLGKRQPLPRTSSCWDGDGNVHLECTIEYHALSQAPPYTALSYCWGDLNDTRPLTANGRLYSIGANAKEALRHLQEEENEVYVWIDQLCINQSDAAEKAEQVRLMWRIYSSADLVVAWLGMPADDSDFIVGHLNRVATLLREAKQAEVVMMHGDGELLRRASRAFRALCDRQYWKRLWVIQEFCSARRVVMACGDARIDYDQHRDAILYFYNRPGQLRSPDGAEEQLDGYTKTRVEMTRAFKTAATSFADGIAGRRRRYHLRRMHVAGEVQLADWEVDIVSQRETLLRVLVSSLVLEVDYNVPESSNPVDRIFSVLNFADDKDDFPGFPDYGRSCEEIYQDAARRMLMQGHIDVLAYCQPASSVPGRSKSVDQPATVSSWAPDWRLPIKRPCVHIWRTTFCASGSNPDEQQYIGSPDPNTITIRGVRVDRIKLLGAEWDPNWLTKLDCRAALRFLAEIRTFCESSPRYTSDPELDAIRVAIADRYNYREPERQPELREGYSEAMAYLENGASGTPNDPYAALGLQTIEDDGIEWLSPWYVFCLKNLHSRRPFVSETGYVGLAPSLALPGDQIVIFLEGKAAYVVRETVAEESTGVYYRLIGECFAHGIMYGEHMELGPEVTTFLLR